MPNYPYDPMSTHEPETQSRLKGMGKGGKSDTKIIKRLVSYTFPDEKWEFGTLKIGKKFKIGRRTFGKVWEKKVEVKVPKILRGYNIGTYCMPDGELTTLAYATTFGAIVAIGAPVVLATGVGLYVLMETAKKEQTFEVAGEPTAADLKRFEEDKKTKEVQTT